MRKCQRLKFGSAQNDKMMQTLQLRPASPAPLAPSTIQARPQLKNSALQHDAAFVPVAP